MDSEEPMDHGDTSTHQLASARSPITEGGSLVDRVTMPTPYYSPHVQHISAAEFTEQSASYTQQAVRELKASPDFKKYMWRCHSCAASWYDGLWGEGCSECGGYAMQQPCPLCSGQCGKVWTRSVDMSHSFHEAHWNGTCGLSPEQQAGHMLRIFVQPNEDELTEALEDLQTD